jgi:hypothetical protein
MNATIRERMAPPASARRVFMGRLLLLERLLHAGQLKM